MVKVFYQSAHYEPIRDRRVRRNRPKDSAILSARFPYIRTQMLDYFEETSFERVGVLHGEYLVHSSGILLLERDGFLTAGCVSLEDPSIAAWLLTGIQQFQTDRIRSLCENDWDNIERGDKYPIICDPYVVNYFHFCLEFIPRARYFSSLRYHPFVTARDSVSKPFQLDLLKRCIPHDNYHILDRFVRIRDPLISHDVMSEEGVFWLREASQISVSTGNRRIYVRRSLRGTRSAPGGGISESPAFLKFLRDFGFECVEFGNGQLDAAQQAALLEGAGIILCAHGAALSNLVYLHGMLSVIEVLGPRTARACFMHLACMLDFNYFGLVSCDYDNDSNIVLDLDELEQAVRAFI